jgi:predicted acylesterase/phospholipase RssA
MIEHLVISSAGPNGLIQMGMLQQLMEMSILDMSTIKSIYGSSAGSILGLLMTLRIPIQDIIDYFVQRPLDKWFKIDVGQMVTHKGIVSSTSFEDLLIPFFNAYDVPISITMQELYERTGVDMHIFTTAVTDMCSTDLNHHTFPELPVILAVSMSSAIPFLFTPIVYKDEYYIDGGLVKHCPVPQAEPDTILVIMMDYKPTVDLECPIQFGQHIIIKLFDIVCANTIIPQGKFVYRFNTPVVSMHPSLWGRVLVDRSYREELIELGKQCIRSNSGDKLPV